MLGVDQLSIWKDNEFIYLNWCDSLYVSVSEVYGDCFNSSCTINLIKSFDL